ncbi:MAG TPA: amidohydrolase family protein [Ruminiclostridium sp.]|nr:amidohydrolase family protein [Ruminiclostridium sp.]
MEEATIAVKGSIITAVGAKDSVAIPEGMKTIDLKGATVMPGFVNAHVHQAYNEKNLENWLKCGVTTVRDESPLALTNSNFLAKRDSLNKDPAHSRVVSGTPILAPKGGYGQDFFTSADSAGKKVSQYISKGVNIVKFSIEDDLQGRKWPLPTYEEVKAIVDSAHANGCKVSVHISHERNLKMAIDAGVDDIAHMVVEPISPENIEQIVQKGIYWEPTLELWSYVSRDYNLDWKDVAIQNLSAFYKAGGKIALGTDFAGYTSSFEYFPDAEVKLMRQAGIKPMDILIAATKNAAEVCGLGDTLGTVEAGKIADLLVVIGDPLAENPQLSLRMVVHGGVIVVDNAEAS